MTLVTRDDALAKRFGAVLACETPPRSEALSKRYGASDGRFPMHPERLRRLQSVG